MTKTVKQMTQADTLKQTHKKKKKISADWVFHVPSHKVTQWDQRGTSYPSGNAHTHSSTKASVSSSSVTGLTVSANLYHQRPGRHCWDFLLLITGTLVFVLTVLLFLAPLLSLLCVFLTPLCGCKARGAARFTTCCGNY